MFFFKMRQFFFALTYLSLLVLTSACGSATTLSNGPSISSAGTSKATPTPAPPVQVSCPMPGTGRAAVMPSLQLGKDQNIVYLTNTNTGGGELMALTRYDVQTGKTTTVMSLPAKTAQISQDGQWVLLSVMVNNVSEIQLVRMDGQFLQTLYCAPKGQQVDPTNATGIQRSPDQQQIIFTQGANPLSSQSLYLLNLATGNVQLELSLSSGFSVLPSTWIDNTRVYVFSNQELLILDLSKGANQHSSDLTHVAYFLDFFRDYTSVYGGNLFAGSVFVGGGPQSTPSCRIAITSAGQSNSTHGISCQKLSISKVRVIDNGSSSLMLQVGTSSSSSNDPNDGFWKINTDGTGLTQLNNKPDGFSQFSQYPWSNFSRDGSLYTDGNSFGSLNGGALTQYSSDSNTRLVGWTTM